MDENRELFRQSAEPPLTRREQLIYAAGLFDGEGCVGVYATAYRHCIVRMAVGMATPQGPSLFAELFGGHVKLCSYRRPKGDGSGYYQPVYHWFLTSARAARALQQLVPFLREKQPQAVLTLEARAIQRHRPRGQGAAWPPADVARLKVIRAEVKALKRGSGGGVP
jgi:hypothetical protein